MQNILRLVLQRRKRYGPLACTTGGSASKRLMEVRPSSLRVLQNTDEARAAFLSRLLTCRPVMTVTNQLLVPPKACGDKQGILRPPATPAATVQDPQLVALAAGALHQAKVATAKAAWQDAVVPLLAEVERLKQRFGELQQHFQSTRTEYLKEVVALRDEQRVRGDPENLYGKFSQKATDVTFFYEPMDSLSEPEREYALLVIKEKLKMIVEANPRVTQTMDFGQVAKLQELFVNSEVETMKQGLGEKSRALADAREEAARLRKELAVFERGKDYAVQQALIEIKAKLEAASQAVVNKLQEEIRALEAKCEVSEASRRKLVRQLAGLQAEKEDVERVCQEQEQALKLLAVQVERTTEEVVMKTTLLQRIEAREAALQDEVRRLRASTESTKLEVTRLKDSNRELQKSIEKSAEKLPCCPSPSVPASLRLSQQDQEDEDEAASAGSAPPRPGLGPFEATLASAVLGHHQAPPLLWANTGEGAGHDESEDEPLPKPERLSEAQRPNTDSAPSSVEQAASAAPPTAAGSEPPGASSRSPRVAAVARGATEPEGDSGAAAAPAPTDAPAALRLPLPLRRDVPPAGGWPLAGDEPTPPTRTEVVAWGHGAATSSEEAAAQALPPPPGSQPRRRLGSCEQADFGAPVPNRLHPEQAVRRKLSVFTPGQSHEDSAAAPEGAWQGPTVVERAAATLVAPAARAAPTPASPPGGGTSSEIPADARARGRCGTAPIPVRRASRCIGAPAGGGGGPCTSPVAAESQEGVDVGADAGGNDIFLWDEGEDDHRDSGDRSGDAASNDGTPRIVVVDADDLNWVHLGSKQCQEKSPRLRPLSNNGTKGAPVGAALMMARAEKMARLGMGSSPAAPLVVPADPSPRRHSLPDPAAAAATFRSGPSSLAAAMAPGSAPHSPNQSAVLPAAGSGHGQQRHDVQSHPSPSQRAASPRPASPRPAAGGAATASQSPPAAHAHRRRLASSPAPGWNALLDLETARSAVPLIIQSANPPPDVLPPLHVEVSVARPCSVASAMADAHCHGHGPVAPQGRPLRSPRPVAAARLWPGHA